MLTNLQKIDTDIVRLQEVPTKFFNELEEAEEFGDHLFPEWTREVYGATVLFEKFEAVYNKYKAIENEQSRKKIIIAFSHSNQVEDLCNRVPGLEVIELGDLDESVRNELDTLFLYLYSTALNYQGFEDYIGKTVAESISDYVYQTNRLNVCPFCGLEAFLMIQGQSRLALDHWLCKDLFPYVSINFDNLIPIGDKCNSRPAKGDTNILIDDPATRNRITSYYPFHANAGISTSFNFVNEPSIEPILEADWEFEFLPSNHLEQDKFNSWNSVFNIELRYLDYFRKNVFEFWEESYKEWVEEDHAIDHATTIAEFKSNIQIYKAGFPIKGRIGSVLYRPFFDYLISDASDGYLYGLVMRFNE